MKTMVWASRSFISLSVSSMSRRDSSSNIIRMTGKCDYSLIFKLGERGEEGGRRREEGGRKERVTFGFFFCFGVDESECTVLHFTSVKCFGVDFANLNEF